MECRADITPFATWRAGEDTRILLLRARRGMRGRRDRERSEDHEKQDLSHRCTIPGWIRRQ